MRTLTALAIGVMLLTPTMAIAENPVEWVRQTLQERVSHLPPESAEAFAIKGTLGRIGTLNLPQEGRVIVVNIASGVVTAYESGTPVIESKAVVGSKATPTPELDNTVTFVRPNPTWTVPQSIVRRKDWKAKVVDDPEFFENAGFDVIVGNQTVSAYEAAENPEAITTFVQRPGAANALGAVKIGLSNDDAIYMHDTNDPGKFEEAVRAASAGCIRIEEIREIAAWILQVPTSQIDAWVDGDDMQNHMPPEPVRVILGYWTAWPDASGRVRFYPDIYGKDGSAASSTYQAAGDDEAEEDQSGQLEEGPRFIPSEDIIPEPIYTERRIQ
jgi:L,D-transpeptidase YcbB